MSFASRRCDVAAQCARARAVHANLSKRWSSAAQMCRSEQQKKVGAWSTAAQAVDQDARVRQCWRWSVQHRGACMRPHQFWQRHMSRHSRPAHNADSMPLLCARNAHNSCLDSEACGVVFCLSFFFFFLWCCIQSCALSRNRCFCRRKDLVRVIDVIGLSCCVCNGSRQ